MSDEPEDKPFKVTFTRFTPENPPPVEVTAISLEHGPMSPVELHSASLLTKAFRLRKELAQWAAAGLPLAKGEVRRERLATCKACPLFDPAGNWGLGECRHGKCGCSKIKAALATSVCPDGRWKR